MVLGGNIMNALDYTRSLAKEKLSSFGKTFDEVKEERYAQRIDAKQRKTDKKLEKFAEQINALPIDKKQELFNKLKDEIWSYSNDSSYLHFDSKERIDSPRKREISEETSSAYMWLHALGCFIPATILLEFFTHNNLDTYIALITSLIGGLSLGSVDKACYQNKPLTNAINDSKTKRNFVKLEGLIDDTNLSTKKMEIVNKSIENELSSDPEVDSMAVSFTNRLAIAEAKKTVDDLGRAKESLMDAFKARKNKSNDEMEM